jgi:alkyldihydroxyacetonephosphate synthase
MMDRKRSLWAWGWEDRFPDDDARRALAAQVAFLSSGPAPSLRSAVPEDAIAIGPARLEVPSSIAAFTSADPGLRARRTYGRGYPDLVRGFAGDFTGAPDLVARPRDAAEIEALFEAAERMSAAVIPWGGGTSVVGGVEARRGPRHAGAIALDLGALDRVLEVDAVSRAARVQAGVLGPALEAQLAPHGLTLRHFPQSFEFSSLGGWIATRAGGHFATLYTHIDDLVESVTMLTPRGRWETRRLPASGAGPDPNRLVIGSEGILGVITEAWVRLQVRPRWRAQASVTFARFEDAVEATRAIAQSGLYPSNCRLLDGREALLHRVAFDGSSVLILAFESHDHPLEPWLARALAIAESHGGSCPKGPRYSDEGAKVDGDAAGAWKAAFLDAPYLQSALVSLGVVVDTFETACTWDRFPSVHAEITAAVEEALRRTCDAGVWSCRFTHVYPDGPAPYYTFIGPRRDGALVDAWAEVKRAASEAIARSGATATHHHAVGRVHRLAYDRERPELFAAALRAVKATVDPAGLLNPGVLID